MKHERMVGTRVSEHLIKDLEQIEAAEHADRATILRRLLARAVREWKIGYFAREYGAGGLSLARAAREAGSPLWTFQAYVRSPDGACTLRVAAHGDCANGGRIGRRRF